MGVSLGCSKVGVDGGRRFSRVLVASDRVHFTLPRFAGGSALRRGGLHCRPPTAGPPGTTVKRRVDPPAREARREGEVAALPQRTKTTGAKPYVNPSFLTAQRYSTARLSVRV